MSLLKRFFPREHPIDSIEDQWKATTDEIRRIATPCPVCSQNNLRGHQYGLFASQIAATVSPELDSFFELYRSRHWQELNSIKEFNGGLNVAILYALVCPKGACMLVVRDPVELYDSSNLLDLILVNQEEVERIVAMPVEWHDL